LPLKKADVVVGLESDVPWIPVRGGPRAEAFVAHVGVDPLFGSLPVRSFRSDLTLTSNAVPFLAALREALERHGARRGADARTARLREDGARWRESLEVQAANDIKGGGAITKLYLSRCISEVRPEDSIVVSEYSLRPEHVNFTQPGTYFLNSTAGGLGWGFPAALGAQQAAPGRVVIALQGDGAYIFSNPAACHQAARLHGLPVLMIVFNNSHYLAVEQSTLAVYPDGATKAYVREHGKGPLSALDPMPDFEKYAEASGGYGERVTAREDLIPALKRALHAVQVEGRHALLNVIGV
jgi:acetolactate synthase-1/2/3 large subunit